MKKINIGIFIFEHVELLDFAGPYEVFSSVRLSKKKYSNLSTLQSPFNIYTISQNDDLINASGGLKIKSDFTLLDSPKPNLLLIPGGIGTRKLLNNNEVLDWIQSNQNIDLLCSVCTGSLLLAKAGLLKNKKVTTHWGAFPLLKKISPTSIIKKNHRFVQDTYLTSAGVSAGIDMSLEIVTQLFGKVISNNTAHYMEYIVNNK